MPGPCTTNHAKGWHSRLNHDFGSPHPCLSRFLDGLQRSHNIVQVRIRGLNANVFDPHPRAIRYAQVDTNLRNAKDRFIQQRHLIQNNNGGPEALVNEIGLYLDYVVHLIG